MQVRQPALALPKRLMEGAFILVITEAITFLHPHRCQVGLRVMNGHIMTMSPLMLRQETFPVTRSSAPSSTVLVPKLSVYVNSLPGSVGLVIA